MSPPIVEIHPASRGSIFKLSPTSQLDYSKRNKRSITNAKKQKANFLISGPSLLSADAGLYVVKSTEHPMTD